MNNSCNQDKIHECLEWKNLKGGSVRFGQIDGATGKPHANGFYREQDRISINYYYTLDGTTTHCYRILFDGTYARVTECAVKYSWFGQAVKTYPNGCVYQGNVKDYYSAA